MKPRIFLYVGALLLLRTFAAPADLSQFAIDERLKIDLYAAEPDVVDPVGLTFDAAGRMYVVEMRDYPYGIGPEKKPGGVIRLLEDTDGDGKADKSTIFARDLSFPTSIVPWNGGVFVTAPPDIIYFKDMDGDGVADQREVYFTGFVQGVTDSNVNGLRWGLDNRIHGLNGGNGGTVRALKFSQPPLPLENADFSFDPKTGEIRKTFQTSGGFGLVFDEFGHSFVTYNINHIQQRIIPLAVLNRFPGMFAVEATQSISDHGEMARIYPISVAETRPNHPEQAGYFSSAGGVGFIGYDAYPGDLYRSITVGDVVGNLLHRDVLQTNGPIFVARRSQTEMAREFIASHDNACRLTGLELGPDGALYVIDMQRDVIEHPDYIPKKILEKINIRAGEDRGRIYRIVPRTGLPREALKLAAASLEQLVAELANHNQWRRQTAQRLLIEKDARSLAPKLANIVEKEGYSPARVHALWTLEGMHRLPETTLNIALRDGDSGLRENALRIVELQQGVSKGTLSLAIRLISDPVLSVRLQLAQILGKLDEERAQAAAAALAISDRGSYWIRVAALASLKEPIAVFQKALAAIGTNHSAADLDLVRDLADLSIARSERPGGALIELLNQIENAPNESALAALEGTERGLGRKTLNQPRLAVQPVLNRIAHKSDDLFYATWSLSRRLGLPETPQQAEALKRAVARAQDRNASGADRLNAVRLLAFGKYELVRDALFTNLLGVTDGELQPETLKSLSAFRDPDVAERLVHQWSALPPGLRPAVINLLLSRRPFHDPLVTAMEKGEIRVGELNLNLEQRRTLLRDSSPDVQARAAKFIGDEEYSNRKSVVEEWIAKLPKEGDPTRGKPVFETVCAQCHRVGDVGKSVGPDLTSVSHRSVEDILSNVLDPNMAINPKFTSYQAETRDGDLITGILEKETPEAVTFLQAGEVRTTVSRKDITRLKSTGISLMPEGLENGLSATQLRDLIAFLQQSSSEIATAPK